MSTKTTKTTKKSTKATRTKAEEAKAVVTEESTIPQSEASPICPSCGSPMVLRSGKFGSFYGCSSFKRGECRATLPVQH